MKRRRAATAAELAALQEQVGGTTNEAGDAGVNLEASWAADGVAFAKAFPGHELTSAEQSALFWQRQQERRLIGQIARLRAWTFWGPFWAILATGALGAVLWLLAVKLLLD